jgi:hypothetical protein
MTFYIHEDYAKYVEASAVGAARGLMGLPLEHPLDVIKTQSQASLAEKSTWRVANRIYQAHGVMGFYSGAIPNGTRLAIKQAYRYPMMLSLPGFFQNQLPANVSSKYKDAIPTATGLTIASFETFFICPLERLKVFLITKEAKKNQLRQFFQMYKKQLPSELYRGIGAVYGRQISTWVSFLVSDKRVKDWERARTQTKQLSFESLMKVSFIVGTFNTIANLPFDVAKTNLQKSDPLENKGLFKTLGKIYQMHGVSGLYAGWKPRMLQYMLQSAFTVTILDRLESSWKNK